MSRTINLSSAQLRAKDKAAQSKFAATKDASLVPPPTRPHGAAQGNYVPPAWHVRAGGDDHFEHTSLPMGAQIQVSQKQKPQPAPTV